MLVCPHCQFENPDAHKFCQNCGGSLIDKACPSCDTLVPLDTQQCPHCGSITGTIWRAILSVSPTNGEQAIALETTLAHDQYLDVQQRYQLIDPLPKTFEGVEEVEARVLDCQPLQPSLLETLYRQPENHLDRSNLEIAQLAIPALAQQYLELQDHYPSLPLPEIHDAWEHNGLNVLLLKDREGLPLLVDCCQNEDILPLQVLHWLHEMVEHWAVLHPQHCCQSLLKLENLRVDTEDHVFCLKRLYQDVPEQSPNLKDLGQLWQTLFEQSRCTQNGNLFLLCRDLIAGAVTSVEELRLRLEEVADALQPVPITMVALPSDSTKTHFPISSLPSSSTSTAVSPGASHPPKTDMSNIQKPLESAAISDEELSSEGDDQPTVVLPMRLISIEDAGRTNTGRQRNHNEDCFYIQTTINKTEIKKLEDSQERVVHAKGLYILCDGMGGHAGGEIASALAVETLQEYFEQNWHDALPNEQTIRQAIELANHAIYDQNQQNSRLGSGRMGTTLVLLLLHDTQVAIAHVGDSRLYRFSRRRGLEQLTADHEVGQREIQRGVDPSIAYARPDAYQLTQALGPRDENFINPDVKFLELDEDALLLLCSDGLTDNEFLELHCQDYLDPLLSTQVELEQGINQLVELANQFNGHDNITTIAIRIKVRPNLSQFNRI